MVFGGPLCVDGIARLNHLRQLRHHAVRPPKMSPPPAGSRTPPAVLERCSPATSSWGQLFSTCRLAPVGRAVRCRQAPRSTTRLHGWLSGRTGRGHSRTPHRPCTQQLGLNLVPHDGNVPQGSPNNCGMHKDEPAQQGRASPPALRLARQLPPSPTQRRQRQHGVWLGLRSSRRRHPAPGNHALCRPDRRRGLCGGWSCAAGELRQVQRLWAPGRLATAPGRRRAVG